MKGQFTMNKLRVVFPVALAVLLSLHASAGQCLGYTQKGARCRNRTSVSYCYLHGGQSRRPAPLAVQATPSRPPAHKSGASSSTATPSSPWVVVVSVTNGVEVVVEGGRRAILAAVVSDNQSNADVLAACCGLVRIVEYSSGSFLWTKKGDCVNVEIARSGHAKYDGFSKGAIADRIIAAEATAKAERLGRWGQKDQSK